MPNLVTSFPFISYNEGTERNTTLKEKKINKNFGIHMI